ncbi:MAG: tetratricopeptide repeat protein [Rhodocyclales bacterium]|nr:tetratricopeptide repeat protein [Rhodocyclales bacterium]
MTYAESRQQAATFNTEQVLQQAVIHHQAGQFQAAGELYRAILQDHPEHSVANHNLGRVAVQMKQPAAGLPYFTAALNADPERGQYWLSYIDALFQAGQLEAAREVMALAQQQGLQGDEVGALAARLEGSARTSEYSNAEPSHAARETPHASSAVHQRSRKSPTAKPTGLDKAARIAASRHGKDPGPEEINALVAVFGQGRFADAASLARKMTVEYPLHWAGWKMLGVVLLQMGRNADALAPMQKAVALSPGDAEARNNLGITLKDMGRLEESALSYRKALEINPDYAQAHGNLGATLQALGRLDEAEARYRQALQINPDYAKVHNNLGAILHDLGRLDEAEPSYRRALQLKPDYVEAYRNLGITLKDLGRLDEAEASLRRALHLNPDLAEVHGNLGHILYDLGRLGEAEASCRLALQIKPDLAEAHNTLGSSLHGVGRLGEAEASFRRALEIKPDFAEALSNLGAILHFHGRLEDAEVAYRRALEIKPDVAGALTNLGVILKDMGRQDEAEAHCRRAILIKPLSPEAHSNLGSGLHDLGRHEEAEACFRRALEIKPDYALAYSNLLFCLTQNAKVDAETLFSEHCRFGDQFSRALAVCHPQLTNARTADRILRIGFVSGDLRNHPVASFIEPVLAHLSTNPEFSLHAYSNDAIEDAVTQRLRELFSQWHFIAGIDDAVLADRIRADGIDILIDLSGHTGKNRLLTFARKPAPVQASWIGYPGTTGLRAMDYYLSDPYFLPKGKFDSQFTEKIIRLPANAPFLPSKDAPPVNTLPALSKGFITFGSFNRLSKLGREVIALWSKLLRSVPSSRMLLGAMPKDGKLDALIEWFETEGIARERLDFYPRSDMHTYLGLHQQVDIGLDTFPYNGGTTTLLALSMGVPTITLSGSTVAGRTGTSILSHVGLEKFVANDAAGFLENGLFWSDNLAALSVIRSGLRERVAKSAIGQPELIAAGLERALRIMWQRWCAGLPAESFEVTRQTIADAARETGQ